MKSLLKDIIKLQEKNNEIFSKNWTVANLPVLPRET